MRFLLTCVAVLASCVTVEAGRCRSVCRSRVVQSCCTSTPAAPCCVSEPTLASACASEPTYTVSSHTREVTHVRASDCAGGTCRSRTVTHTTATYSLAQSKAERMASTGMVHHVSGGFGGGSFEGVGMGATREQAISNCCFWGQRTPVDIGAAQAANGQWFATVLYR